MLSREHFPFHAPIIDDLIFLTWLSGCKRAGGPEEVEGATKDEPH